MTIHLNPLAQAEADVDAFLAVIDAPPPAVAEGGRMGVIRRVMLDIIQRAVAGEVLMRGAHPGCDAENPGGKPAGCQCPCHKGHFRHFWKQVNTTPVINPDGVTYHIVERCRYCPDVKLVIIKAGFKNEKHGVVSLEYLIRGEGRVLTREEWHERKPEPQTGEFLRKVGL